MRFKKIRVSVLALGLTCFASLVAAHDPSAPFKTVGEPTVREAKSLTGVVNEIIVDDSSKGVSQRYTELELDDGTLVPLRGNATDALAKGDRVAVAGHQQGKALEVGTTQILSRGRNTTPKAETELEGTLAILHADYFAEGKSTFIYELHDASGRVHRLKMGSLPSMLEPGMKVRVTGQAAAEQDQMTPARITILARPTTGTNDKSVVEKAAVTRSVLVIMANFNNTAAPTYSSSQAQQVMVTNSDSVANFYREASFGQEIMNVTITPNWVPMNLSVPATCGTSDWRAIGTAADAAAKSLGAAYDPAAYNFVVYLFPKVPACGWLGLGYISNPHKAWINGTGAFRTSAVAHEMGHNYGLLHAASLRCATAIGGSCSVAEYGDPFDTMGNQSAMHFNAQQKAKLAWVPSSAVRVHSGGSATYTLNPIEVAGGSTYAVKIPTTASNRTYWLEFRQPIGFDGALANYPNNGAQIRVANPFESQCSGCDAYSDDTQLLDMTPATPSFNDAALVAGQTFTDATYGVSITVVSASASALTVQVGTGGQGVTGPGATSTTMTSSPNPSITGANVTFTASVSGNAPSGSVRFTDNGSTISGCSSVALAGSGNTRTASCSTNALTTGGHAIVASYNGDAANTASSATSLQTVSAPIDGTNVASAANGGVATASSVHDEGFGTLGVNDGRRSGSVWGAYGGWNDATPNVFPDWVQINFNGTKTIDHVVVYSLQDNYPNPVEPTDAMKFTLYGLTAFDVQGWNGSAWVTLGSVTGNNLVKRVVSFTPFATDRIRVVVNAAADALWSRITEIEAWTPSPVPSQTNWALASNGSTASASSTFNPGYPASSVIDNKRSGAGWGAGGGWNDLTTAVFPDWVQINFAGTKTIDHVVVYTIQDNAGNPVEPTDAMTFDLYGVTSFQVQAWNGSSWVIVGSVTNNRYVKRAVAFAPITTDRIRIVGMSAADGAWCRITEVEAWGN
jgi:hypothetical protein